MASEIDARVAREVMGFDVHHSGETPAFCEDREYAFEYYAVGPGGEKKIYALPAYSTDMNAAMEVVARMFDSGWLMELSNHRNVVWFAWFKRIENEHEFVAKQASRPALAICLAALEAVKNG